MTELIVIDESGDLGSKGTKYFTISSIIATSYRQLKPTFKLVRGNNSEIKYHKSNDILKTKILKNLTEQSVSIAYVSVKKSNRHDSDNVYGKELYKRCLKELLNISINIVKSPSVNIVVDENWCITQEELKLNTQAICKDYSKKLKICRKGISQNEPCIRIADFIAGAIQSKYEKNDP